jgi:hypothetical protein
VEKNVKMLDLENNNSTHTHTRAVVVVNTTVKPEVVKTTEPPTLNVEEEHMNIRCQALPCQCLTV